MLSGARVRVCECESVSLCESTCGYVHLYVYGVDIELPFSSPENLPGPHPLKVPAGPTLPHI